MFSLLESSKFSTSVLVILPFGPDPEILDKEIPLSSAYFLAMGDAMIVEFSGVLSTCGVGCLSSTSTTSSGWVS